MPTDAPAAAAALSDPADADESLTWPAVYLAVHGTLFVGGRTASLMPSTDELGIQTPKTSQAVNREPAGSSPTDRTGSHVPNDGEDSTAAASTSASACLCVANLGWDGLRTPPETLFESLRSAAAERVTVWPIDDDAAWACASIAFQADQASLSLSQVADMGLDYKMQPAGASERLGRHADPKCVALLNTSRHPNVSLVVFALLSPEHARLLCTVRWPWRSGCWRQAPTRTPFA